MRGPNDKYSERMSETFSDVKGSDLIPSGTTHTNGHVNVTTSCFQIVR